MSESGEKKKGQTEWAIWVLFFGGRELKMNDE